jgi:hypothetical protein
LPRFLTLVQEGPFAKRPDRRGPQAKLEFPFALLNESLERRRFERAAHFLTRPVQALIIILEVFFNGRVAPGQVPHDQAEYDKGWIYVL